MSKIKLVIGPRSFFDKQINMPDLMALETYVTFFDQTNHNLIEAANEDKFREKLLGKTLYGTSESFAAITQSGIERKLQVQVSQRRRRQLAERFQ